MTHAITTCGVVVGPILIKQVDLQQHAVLAHLCESLDAVVVRVSLHWLVD